MNRLDDLNRSYDALKNEHEENRELIAAAKLAGEDEDNSTTWNLNDLRARNQMIVKQMQQIRDELKKYRAWA